MKGVAIEVGGGTSHSPPMQIASPFPSVLLSIFFPLLFLLSHFYSFFFIPLFLIEWRLDWVLLCKPKGDLESQQFFSSKVPGYEGAAAWIRGNFELGEPI